MNMANEQVNYKAVLADLEAQKAQIESAIAAIKMIAAQRAGVPIAMDLEDLSPYEERELPTIQQMSGLVKDFTGGQTLKEFLEDDDE